MSGLVRVPPQLDILAGSPDLGSPFSDRGSMDALSTLNTDWTADGDEAPLMGANEKQEKEGEGEAGEGMEEDEEEEEEGEGNEEKDDDGCSSEWLDTKEGKEPSEHKQEEAAPAEQPSVLIILENDTPDPSSINNSGVKMEIKGRKTTKKKQETKSPARKKQKIDKDDEVLRELELMQQATQLDSAARFNTTTTTTTSTTTDPAGTSPAFDDPDSHDSLDPTSDLDLGFSSSEKEDEEGEEDEEMQDREKGGKEEEEDEEMEAKGVKDIDDSESYRVLVAASDTYDDPKPLKEPKKKTRLVRARKHRAIFDDEEEEEEGEGEGGDDHRTSFDVGKGLAWSIKESSRLKSDTKKAKESKIEDIDADADFGRLPPTFFSTTQLKFESC